MNASIVVLLASLALGQAERPYAFYDSAMRLRLHLPPGQTVVYRFVDEQTIRDQAPKVPVIHSKTTSWLRLHGKREDEGTIQLTCEFDRIVLELDGGKMKETFDSSEAPGRRESGEFTAFRQVVGTRFVVMMKKDGSIVEIKPEEEIDPASPANMAGQGHLRRLLVFLCTWLPKDDLKDGKSWQRREELPTGLVDLMRENSLRIIGKQGPEWTVESKIRLLGKPTKSQGVEGETVIASLTTEKPGLATIKFDVDQGLVQSIVSEVDFTMLVTRVKKDPNPIAVESAQALSSRASVELLPPGESGRAN